MPSNVNDADEGFAYLSTIRVWLRVAVILFHVHPPESEVLHTYASDRLLALALALESRICLGSKQNRIQVLIVRE